MRTLSMMLRRDRVFNGYHRWFSSKVSRNESFARISSEDVSMFQRILGGNKKRVMVRGEGDEEIDEIVESHNTDWMRRWKGDSSVVLFPDSTQQVSDILRYCNNKKIAVTPQGGNTGYVVSLPIVSIQHINTHTHTKQVGGRQYPVFR